MNTNNLEMAFGTFDQKHVIHYIGKKIWMIMVGNINNTLYYNSLSDSSTRKEFLNTLTNFTINNFHCHEYNKYTESFNIIEDKKSIRAHIRNRMKRVKHKKFYKSLEIQYYSSQNKISYADKTLTDNCIPDAIESFIPIFTNGKVEVEDSIVSSHESIKNVAEITSILSTEKESSHQKQNKPNNTTSTTDNVESNDPSAILGLKKCPFELYEMIMKKMIEMYVISIHKVQVNRQLMEQVGTKIKNYHTVLPFFKRSSNSKCSENFLASILYYNLKTRRAGIPEAVDCDLHEQYWGKNVYLNMQTSWEGMSLGCYNRNFLIILWAKDASKAFEITLRTSVSMLELVILHLIIFEF